MVEDQLHGEVGEGEARGVVPESVVHEARDAGVADAGEQLAFATEYRADLVVLLLEGRPVFAIVVEVQLTRDEDKRGTWPLYLASLRSRVGCPTALLVVAPEAGVARWCAQPIELGHPGFVLRPLVAGPDAVPVLTDVREARREPELAVLSAMAHGHGEEGARIAQVVMEAVVGLDEERVRLYVDLAMCSLGEAARHALEELMRSGTYEYQSEFARKYVAQGREEGLQEGLQKGLQKGEKEALLEVLDARGLKVDAAARQRIQECTQLAQLKRWLRRAVTVHSVQELFARGPASKPTPRGAKKRGRAKSPAPRGPRSR